MLNHDNGGLDYMHLELGEKYVGIPVSLSSSKDPIVAVTVDDGTVHNVLITECINKNLKERSNQKRDDIIEGDNDPVKVYILKKLGRNDEANYLGFIFPENPDFNCAVAHRIIKSPHVFYSRCFYKGITRRDPRFEGGSPRKEMSWSVGGYDNCHRYRKGFLKPVNKGTRNVPWEYDVEKALLESEKVITKELLTGNPRFQVPGIEEGDALTVRLIGDNSHLRKPNVTYFFEPVVNLRLCDEAVDYEGNDLVTRVTRNGQSFEGDFKKGDIISALPVLSPFETEKNGLVGVGYIPETIKEWSPDRTHGVYRDHGQVLSFSKGSFLFDKVWVKGAFDDIGQLVDATITFVQDGLVIAQKIR